MIICVANIALNIFKKKTPVIYRLNSIVRTLNMNEYGNAEKLYGILTNFIRKMTDYFFTIIGEKDSSNNPLKKMYSLEKVQS